VSRKGKKFHQFDPLLKQVLRCLKGHRVILDGEIVEKAARTSSI
jgi:ATP-dependent DNA ligase